MAPTLQQATLVSAHRLTGTLIGTTAAGSLTGMSSSSAPEPVAEAAPAVGGIAGSSSDSDSGAGAGAGADEGAPVAGRSGW